MSIVLQLYGFYGGEIVPMLENSKVGKPQMDILHTAFASLDKGNTDEAYALIKSPNVVGSQQNPPQK